MVELKSLKPLKAEAFKGFVFCGLCLVVGLVDGSELSNKDGLCRSKTTKSPI